MTWIYINENTAVRSATESIEKPSALPAPLIHVKAHLRPANSARRRLAARSHWITSRLHLSCQTNEFVKQMNDDLSTEFALAAPTGRQGSKHCVFGRDTENIRMYIVTCECLGNDNITYNIWRVNICHCLSTRAFPDT